MTYLWNRAALALALVACSALAPGCGDGAPATQPPADTGVDAAPDIAPDIALDIAPDTSPDVAPDTALDAPADTAPPRCTTAADCAGNPAGSACDAATGRCVQCVPAMDTCPAAQHCDAATNACVAGCRSDEGCAATDGGVGDGGAPGGTRCDTATHTCVACVTDDHCALGQRCMGNTCVPGCDATRGCPADQTCCAGGCVDTRTNTAHCGACGTACAVSNGTAACTAGACAVASCAEGFGNCDATATNGCETDTRATLAHCGACGTACAARAGATAACAASRCEYTCETGLADCDAMATTGCETDTRTTLAHCGGCGMACAARANATASCAASRCAYACNAGFADCDGDAANGCETDTRSSTTHCGMCGRACAFANAAATCSAGACMLGACDEGFASCDADATNGCETNVRTSTAHCGTCGRACAPANATPACTAGACGVAACATGFGDCDGMAATGCETSTRTAVAHCGMCGNACPARANATARCASAACGFTCTEGYDDCNATAADGCETNILTSPAHCGGCGAGFACAAGQVCASGGCAAPASCAALLAQRPTAPSGTYTIDPDGAGGAAPFAVHCDMTADGGGWTLVLMAGSSPAGTLGFDAAAWTDSSVLNATVTDPAMNVSMKSAAFNALGFTAMRLCVGSLTACVSEPVAGVSARALFAGGERVGARTVTDLRAWGYTGTLGCNRIAFNVYDVGAGSPAASRARCRYGILLNNEATCEGSVDGGRGLGCRGYYGTQISAGQGDGIVSTSHERGWIFVR